MTEAIEPSKVMGECTQEDHSKGRSEIRSEDHCDDRKEDHSEDDSDDNLILSTCVQR